MSNKNFTLTQEQAFDLLVKANPNNHILILLQHSTLKDETISNVHCKKSLNKIIKNKKISQSKQFTR